MIEEDMHTSKAKMKCLICGIETDAGVEVDVVVDKKAIRTCNEVVHELLPRARPLGEPIRETVLVPLCNTCQELVPPMVIRLTGILAALKQRGLFDDRLLG